jgi:GT2 family glycosyltransferase
VVSAGSADFTDLLRTVDSIQRQTNCSWTLALLLAKDSPVIQDSQFTAWRAAHPDVQIVWVDGGLTAHDWLPAAGHLSAEWLVPLQAGDQLSANWASLVRAHLQPDVDIVYWDEDELSTRGKRAAPFFKPDWSPELLFSVNYLEHAAFRKSLLCSIPQAGEGPEAGWIFRAGQMARRVVHIPFILSQHAAGYSAGHLNRMTRHAAGAQAFLERSGLPAVKTWVTETQHLRVSWESSCPLVSVVIPTKNNLRFLKRCISTLFEKTDYPAFEVILVDDHSTDPAVLAYYDELLITHTDVSLYHNEEKFNYSRVNNQGAARAKGDLLLFLNNDVEILESGWLKEMVRWAQQPGVGMVGAKLLYPDGQIQHAGIVLGLTGHAGHVYSGKPALPAGLFVSPDAYRNVSAVTGACMLVRKDLFQSLGGFEEQLGLVFNDVDLGLRVHQSGYRIVYTPAAVLLHHEGRSRARYIPREDIRLGAARLSKEIAAGDAYYNPNLSLAVNWPTLRRRGEPPALRRLEKIVRYKG